MSGDQDFRTQQRAVAMRMLVGIVATVLVAWIAIVLTPPNPPDSMARRLQWLARAELCVGAWLAAAIANVARLRFFSSDDIAGSSSGPTSQAVRNAGSVLQNTLEQVVVATIAYTGVALSVDRPAFLLIALAGMFSIGRALFWLGFPHGAAQRALGFGMTFYPSIAALAISVAATAMRPAA